MFWTTIAVLWTALLGGSAFGETRPAFGLEKSLTADFDRALVVPAANVSTPAVAGLPTARAIAMDPTRGPVIVLGSGGGTELIGGAIACGLLLQYARRRRLI